VGRRTFWRRKWGYFSKSKVPQNACETEFPKQKRVDRVAPTCRSGAIDEKILLSAAVMFAFATPGFAQSYSASYETGNLIDLEKTNGTYGYFRTVAPPQTTRASSTARAASGISAYAYSLPISRRHKAHGKLR